VKVNFIIFVAAAAVAAAADVMMEKKEMNLLREFISTMEIIRGSIRWTTTRRDFYLMIY
jgi:hypothetical protein